MRYVVLCILFLTLLLSASCGPTCDHAGEYSWSTDGHQEVVDEFAAAPRYIVDGIEYAGIDGAELQTIVNETVACVGRVAKPYAPDAYCHQQVEPPCRECIQVLVSDQWSWSCDGLEQLLHVDAPQASCALKGFEHDPDCPCRFRGGTMRNDNHNLIVVTPNLRMLRYELVRYWAGCWNPVYDARLAACGVQTARRSPRDD